MAAPKQPAAQRRSVASEEAAVKKPSAEKVPFEGITASGERIEGEIDRRFLISQPNNDSSPETGEQGGTTGVNQVTVRAIEVIGDREEALRWLGTPVRGLGYRTPISLLHDSEGQRKVLTLLGRLEHGVL